MSEEFFTESQKAEISNPDNQSGNQNEEQPFLSVGERVFKTKEDVINNISSAQEHISKVEKNYEDAVALIEKQESLLEKSSKVDELMEALTKRRESSGEDEATTSLSKEDLIADVLKAFDQLQYERKSVETQEGNYNSVKKVLLDTYSDKADEVVQKVVRENDLTMEEAISLAKANPKVFLRMFDFSKRTAATVNHSSVNTESLRAEHSNKPPKPIMDMSIKERAAYVRSKLGELS